MRTFYSPIFHVCILSNHCTWLYTDTPSASNWYFLQWGHLDTFCCPMCTLKYMFIAQSAILEVWRKTTQTNKKHMIQTRQTRHNTQDICIHVYTSWDTWMPSLYMYMTCLGILQDLELGRPVNQDTDSTLVSGLERFYCNTVCWFLPSAARSCSYQRPTAWSGALQYSKPEGERGESWTWASQAARSTACTACGFAEKSGGDTAVYCWWQLRAGVWLHNVCIYTM